MLITSILTIILIYFKAVFSQNSQIDNCPYESNSNSELCKLFDLKEDLLNAGFFI